MAQLTDYYRLHQTSICKRGKQVSFMTDITKQISMNHVEYSTGYGIWYA